MAGGLVARQQLPRGEDWTPLPLVIKPSEPGKKPLELPAGYSAMTWESPLDLFGRTQLFEPTGIAIAKDGTIVVSTRTAGVWRIRDGKWSLFAENAYESLGVVIEDDKGDRIVISQKPEITRLIDTDGNGRADVFDTVCDDFGFHGNYHEYTHGPVRDKAGNYYFLLPPRPSSGSTIAGSAGRWRIRSCLSSFINYGDRSLLEEQVPVALKWLETEAAARKDGLVVKGLGDHEALTNSIGAQMTAPMFVDAARRCARLAEIIGNKEAAARCVAMADESAAAWAKAFLDPETGKVATGNQTEQLMALGFGTAPEEARPKVYDQLIEAVNGSENGPAPTTGIYGTRFLMEELSKGGRSNLAYKLAEKKTFPLGWMIENGATTLWEGWQGGDNVKSHNHPMFGSISGWFHLWLGGIQAAEDAVGYDSIHIRPQVVDGLTYVKCSHRTIRGLVVSNWTKGEGKTEFEITIPPDTEALVELPLRKGLEYDERWHLMRSVGAGLQIIGPHSSVLRLKLGSGRYNLTTAAK